jgi:hypothetical protein
MSPEKDKELCEKYPRIFENRNSKESRYPIAWGVTCGDGWFDVMDSACYLIQTHCDRTQEKYNKDIQVVALQVKEKFGSLRFYVAGGDDYTDGVIAMAESLSNKICENCGNAGRLYSEGYWVTQCEECRKKYLEKNSHIIK